MLVFMFKPSISSILLYDATWIYLRVLEDMLRTGDDYKDGRAVFNRIRGRTFNGEHKNITGGNVNGHFNTTTDYV